MGLLLVARYLGKEWVRNGMECMQNGLIRYNAWQARYNVWPYGGIRGSVGHMGQMFNA